jgi:hypothetical protein
MSQHHSRSQAQVADREQREEIREISRREEETRRASDYYRNWGRGCEDIRGWHEREDPESVAEMVAKNTGHTLLYLADPLSRGNHYLTDMVLKNPHEKRVTLWDIQNEPYGERIFDPNSNEEYLRGLAEDPDVPVGALGENAETAALQWWARHHYGIPGKDSHGKKHDALTPMADLSNTDKVLLALGEVARLLSEPRYQYRIEIN